MHVYLYLLLLIATVTYALWRGGAPERATAAAIVVAVVLTITAGEVSRRVFASREVVVFCIDTALCVTVMLVALRAERFWPLWLAAVLILEILLQLAIWYAPLYYRDVYLILHAMSAYPTLALLLIGTARHSRRLRMTLPELDWSSNTMPHRQRTAL